MPFTTLTPVLPCRNRDDATEVRTSAHAGELLAARTALFHPALIAATGTIPRWSPAEAPPDDPAGHLMLLPPTAEQMLPEDWLSHAEQLGARLIRGHRERPAMVAAALATLDPPPPDVDAELCADFLALGFCHFVVEIITINIRYTNSLDETAFEREVVSAAKAACQGEGDAARGHLQAAFDLLHTARDSYYPSESRLLDLTLVAETTLGTSLRRQLARSSPTSLLISGKVLEQMAQREPATLAALRQAVDGRTASVIGGEYLELELPLLPPEAIRRQLEKGLAVYRELLDLRLTHFGRRRFGMTPVLPQILDHLGFSGMMHATLDDGHFPTESTSRLRWEGIDGSTVEAIFRVPIDAARPDGFLRLPHTVSGATDMDNLPTVIVAHWPGSTSPWHEDVLRARRYTTVLGTQLTMSDYFDQTGVSGHQTIYKADEYRSPYLRQAVDSATPDPISRWTRYYRRRATAEAIEAIGTLAGLLTGRATRTSENLLAAVDDSILPPPASGEGPGVRAAVSPFDSELARSLDDAIADFAPAIGAHPSGKGTLVVNPLSFSRRVAVETPGGKMATAEVPAMGFVWISPEENDVPDTKLAPRFGIFRKQEPLPPQMAELTAISPTARGAGEVGRSGAVLRNEFFELMIDSASGAIRSIFDFKHRAPRLAQQVAMRLAVDGDDEAYTIAAADEIRVISAGPVVGEVLVRGHLKDRDGCSVSGFQQTTRVRHGSRVIEIEIELDPQRELSGDPWTSYYAARFAWGDEAAAFYRGVNQAMLPTEAMQIESPHCIDIRAESRRLTILTAGLPYHRRWGTRKLDSLLVVRGETARQFRLGIGIDLPQPMAAAVDFIAPVPTIADVVQPTNRSGWLFHLDTRAAIATHWEPLLEGGRAAGYRVRLLETEGRNAMLGLRSYRAPQSAQKAGRADYATIDLTIESDRVAVPMRPYEWADVEVRFG